MPFDPSLVSDAFRAFAKETPDHAAAWMTLVQSLRAASALDPKTAELAHLAVLASLERTSGIPFHVDTARSLGASREEILSALLIGLPVAGHAVTAALPVALAVLDEEAG